MQRVVSGSLGGRRLMDLPRSVTGVRPSGAKVRSAIFDRLQAEVRGARVLDLCAGTGALAIEALSRGAASAVLVDRHKPVCEFLRTQVEALGVSERAEVVHADARRWVADASTKSFDLILCDPPYDDLALLEELAGACERLLADEGVLVCERERGRGLGPVWPSSLEHDASRQYGTTVLEFFSPKRTT